jgi:hypothetical protein
MTVTASNTVSYSETDDTRFGPPLTQAPGPKRVLQLLAFDVAQLVQSRAWLSASGDIRCPGDEGVETPSALEECHNNPVQLEVTDALFVNYNGSLSSPGAGDPAINNYFQALSAASLGDTGLWYNNSIFVSASIVNATLQPGPSAESLREDPSSFTFSPTPAVISMSYTCHFQRRKHALNFVICLFTHSFQPCQGAPDTVFLQPFSLRIIHYL